MTADPQTPEPKTAPPEKIIGALQAHLEEANELIAYLRNRLGNVRAQIEAAYADAITDRDQRILDLETQLRDSNTSPTTGSAG